MKHYALLGVIAALSLGWTHGGGFAPGFSQAVVSGGGYVTGIDISPDGSVILARDDTYDAFVWNAGTSKWQSVTRKANLPAADYGFFPATGTSQIWQYSTNSIGVTEIVSCPSQPATAYMVFQGKLMRSTNMSGSGTPTWTKLRTMFTFPVATSYFATRYNGKKIACDPANPNHVLVGDPYTGMYEALDGVTFASVTSSGIPVSSTVGGVAQAYSIAFDAGSGTTTRSGQTVTNIAYAYLANGANNGAMYMTGDGGASWAAVTATGAPSATIGASHLVVDSNYGNAWLSTGTNGSGRDLYRYGGGRTSGTSGTWTAMGIGSGNGVHSAAIDPSPSGHSLGDRIVAVGMDGKPQVTVNANAATPTWTALTYTLAGGDSPWMAQNLTYEFFMSGGDSEFNPAGTNELWMVEGIGAWTANPPASGNNQWTARSNGIENLVVTSIQPSPRGGFMETAWDRQAFTNTAPYASTAFQYGIAYNGKPVSKQIAPGWAIAPAASDPNTFGAWVSNSYNTQLSGISKDGGATWTPFGTGQVEDVAIAGIAAAPTTNYVRATVADSSKYTGWSAGSGDVVHALPSGDLTVQADLGYYPVSIVDATHIDLLYSTYGSTWSTAAGFRLAVEPNGLKDSFTGHLSVVGTANNNGLVEITVASDSAILSSGGTGSWNVDVSGVGGTTEANGTWNLVNNQIAFNGSVSSGSDTLTVTSIFGNNYVLTGRAFTSSVTAVPGSTTILSQIDGTPGGAGHYQMSATATANFSIVAASINALNNSVANHAVLMGSAYANAYTSGGHLYAPTFAGGYMAASTPLNMVAVGGNNAGGGWPLCTADGGKNWSRLAFQYIPPPEGGKGDVASASNIITNLNFDATQYLKTGTTFSLSAADGLFSSATISSIDSASQIHISATASGTTAQDSFTFSTGFSPSNTSRVQGRATADTVTANTFYIENSLLGLYKFTNCGQAALVLPFNGSGWSFSAGTNDQLKAEPGFSGSLYFTIGQSGSEPTLHPTSTFFWHLQDDGAGNITPTQVSNFREVWNFAWGKAAPGQTHSAMYVLGFYDGDPTCVAAGGWCFGLYRSTDGASTWTKLADQFPLGTMDLLSSMAADPSNYGVVYFGFRQTGAVIGYFP